MLASLDDLRRSSSPAIPSVRGLLPYRAALFDLTNVGACSYLQVTKGLPGTFTAVTTRLDLRIEDEGIFNTVSFAVTPKLSFSLSSATPTARSRSRRARRTGSRWTRSDKPQRGTVDDVAITTAP